MVCAPGGMNTCPAGQFLNVPIPGIIAVTPITRVYRCTALSTVPLPVSKGRSAGTARHAGTGVREYQYGVHTRTARPVMRSATCLHTSWAGGGRARCCAAAPAALPHVPSRGKAPCVPAGAAGPDSPLPGLPPAAFVCARLSRWTWAGQAARRSSSTTKRATL